MDHRRHAPIAVVAGVIASLSVSIAFALNRQRVARIVRDIQKNIARMTLDGYYLDHIKQIDAKAELFSITFVNRNRDLFNRRAEFYVPRVSDRGRYLLNARYQTRALVSMLLLRDLARRHIAELEKVDAHRAKAFADASKKLDNEADRLVAQMRHIDFPVKLLVAEYEASIIRIIEIR